MTNFIHAFFAAVPGLRRQSPDSVWRQLDINARLPGWTRYAAAEPRRVLSAASSASWADGGSHTTATTLFGLKKIEIALEALGADSVLDDAGTNESIFGKTICIPRDRDVSALNAHGRNWLSEKRVVVVRQPTLLDCVSIVQRREADAFVANDLEGRYVLGRLGLVQLFTMAERPLGTRGVHAIVSRDHAQASELVGVVNRGLKELKQTDAYASIVRQHLMRLWDARAGAP